MLRAVIVATTLVGCYSPSYQDCAISCAMSGECPSGFDCVEGVCRSMTGACGGGSGTVDAPAGAWQFRKKLTFGRVEASSSDFAVLVRIPADQDLANFAQDDGDDIRFTLLDGATTLPHEIERFDPDSGALLAWVKVTLSSNAANDLYMYYGNAATGSLQNPGQVWDSDYVGVWHLSDPPGAALADSTANDHDGAKSSPGSPAPVETGQIGGAQVYSNSPAEYFSVTGTAVDLDLPQLTFEAWMSPTFTGASGTLQRLLEFPATFQHHPTIDYQGLMDQRYLAITLGGNGGVRSELGRIDNAKWNHIVVTIDTTTPNFAQVYINGAPTPTSGTQFGNAQSNALVTIGGSQNSTSLSFNGMLDEVRVSRTIRSVEYIRNAYTSQSNTQYVTVGAAENVR